MPMESAAAAQPRRSKWRGELAFEFGHQHVGASTGLAGHPPPAAHAVVRLSGSFACMVAESACLLLLSEAVKALATGSDGSDGSEDGSTQREGAAEERVRGRVEDLGFTVGSRFVERVAQQRVLSHEQLEVMKFICKDFWNESFGKPIDKLQTNHRGVFVLKDENLRWIAGLSGAGTGASLMRERLLRFPCGLVRGALQSLGLDASVSAEWDAATGVTAFHVKVAAW